MTSEEATPVDHGTNDRTRAPGAARWAGSRRRLSVSAFLALITGRCGDLVSLIIALDQRRRVGINLSRSLQLARLQGSPLTSEEVVLVRECLEFIDRMRAKDKAGRAAVVQG